MRVNPVSYPVFSVTELAQNLLQLTLQLTGSQQKLLVCAPDGIILAATPSAQKIITLDQVAGVNISNAFSALDRKKLTDAFLKLPQKKHARLNVNAPSNHKAELSLHFTYIQDYESRAFVCCTLSDKSPDGKVLNSEKITEDNYKEIFENSFESVCILDAQGHILELNKAALQLSSYRKEDLLHKPISEILEFNHFESSFFQKRLNQALNGNIQKFDSWFKGKNQELITVEIVLTPGYFQGQKVIIASAVDSLDRLSTEQNIRLRNDQLEFVNFLFSHLPRFKTTEEILQFTLEQLMEKTVIIGGGIYLYQEADHKLNLLSATGTNHLILNKNPVVALNPALRGKLIPKAIRESAKLLNQNFERLLDLKNFVLMPVSSDTTCIGALVLFLHNPKKITFSFTSLIDTIGNEIGQYITKHELNQQLSYSESKYQALFDSSPDAIILSDGLQIADCNRATQFLTGLTRNILITKTLPEILGNNNLKEEEKINNYLQEVINNGGDVKFEWKRNHPELPPLETEISLNRILISGKFYIQTIIRDVTELKQTQLAKRNEEILTESINQFREFISKVEMAYISLDCEGRIKYLNHYFEEILGYRAEELVGKDYFELFISDAERPERKEQYLKMIWERKLIDHFERDIQSKTGEVKTFLWQRMFEYDANGNISGIISLGKDITDKKLAMEALKDNKSRLQDIFDNAHDLIQNVSTDNRFIFVNKAWQDKLGYDDYDIEKLSLNDIVHPYYKAKLIYQLRNLYKGENVNKIETVFLTKQGKPVHLIGSINCTWQNGKAVATRAILHDITDRIKAERLQKVYYSIANLAISSKDLQSLYGAIHRELSKIIETNNIYIALCDDERTQLNFAYYIDQHKPITNFEIERPYANGISEYIINLGKPLYMLREDLVELENKGLLQVKGIMPEVILCSPLMVGERTIGVIAVQDYRKQEAYVSSDIEILHFISNQVALAIERKRNEVQINNQNARLKAIFESGSHLMWSLNRNYLFTSFNQNFANFLSDHWGIEAQLNSQFFDNLAISTNNQSYNQANEIHIWEELFDKVFSGQPCHFELRIAIPDGQIKWQEIFLNPIYLEDGSFEEISAMALDITEKKFSELALQENEEKFRSIFESFQDLYYQTNLDGLVTLMSPSVTEMLGYTPEEVKGMPAIDFYADLTDRERLMQKLKENGRVRNFEATLKGKDNSLKDVLLNSTLVYDSEGNVTGYEGVARDISDIKKIQLELIKAKELAESSLQAKTLFLANMSHELRTPMNGIIGMIDLLFHTIKTEEQHEYVDTLRKSSEALLAILNDILDFSKIQAGKLTLNETGIDLHYTLSKVHNLFVNRAQQKNLRFNYYITPHTPQFIQTDENRLLQILSNLTSNAIKFTNNGSVHINVSSISNDGEFSTIMFRVKDSGIGITEENKKLLFTNFTQLDNTSTKSFGGTGLGLAISKQLSELLGGEISVDSVYGEGSTFWFTIKCKLVINEEEIREIIGGQQPGEGTEEVEQFATTPYVLLVDDNAINQKVAEKILVRLGCKADIASNGFEAIEQAATNAYDMIFMDIQMPEMDGVTATAEIKKVLGASCPPIIAMTAYSMKDDADKFLGQGLDDYVSKPIKESILHNVIKKWFIDKKNENPFAVEAEVIPTDEPEAAEPILDDAIIDQMRLLGGDDFAKQLYDEFTEETDPLLQEAGEKVAEQQYNDILGILHQLKGTSSTLGINLFADIAKKLEHNIKKKELSNVNEDFALLLEHYSNFKKVYPKKFTHY
ncbi:PAS domain S-box protein [Adhaeribacter rhizoryzae]|uniref:Sensory/regulatory protein RpfC n=1 Tax=Adhaeribacter rhizoryzae TaxID=2607907 RepID=A0A5M6DBJ9_9BACT|nr:PAS domain S-box protein [Adhaeribacter rhizoryzae]KAA5542525.1 PAS domain S-box protein [Adhaeribacter rhizoryzae]